MSTSFNNDIRKFRAHERGKVVGRKLDLIADLAAETIIVSRFSAVSWNTVGKSFFIPTGEQPPWT